jgi:CHAD domain-containing protein
MKFPVFIISDQSQPVQELFRLISEQTEWIIYHCQIIDQSPPTSVHEIRKAFKRIRAILQILYFINGHEFYRELGKNHAELARHLGPMRDAIVRIQTLERIASSSNHKVHPLTFLALKKRMSVESEKTLPVGIHLNELASDISRKTMDLRTRLELSKPGMANLDAIPYALAKSLKRLDKRLCRAENEPSPENIHRLRKQVKYLQYQHNACSKLTILPEGWISQVNQLGELLGQYNDIYQIHLYLENRSIKRLSLKNLCLVISEMLNQDAAKLLRECRLVHNLISNPSR